jgi:hypothetical protein
VAAVSNQQRQLDQYCRQAGMDEDSPLRLALVTVMEAAEKASDAVKDGARGLTPQGEADLIRRLTDTVAEGTEREAERIVRRLDFRMGMVVTAIGAALLGGGYYWGRSSGDPVRVAAVESAAFVAQLAELNDFRAIRDYCLKHAIAQQGGTACKLPMVWVKQSVH